MCGGYWTNFRNGNGICEHKKADLKKTYLATALGKLSTTTLCRKLVEPIFLAGLLGVIYITCLPITSDPAVKIPIFCSTICHDTKKPSPSIFGGCVKRGFFNLLFFRINCLWCEYVSKIHKHILQTKLLSSV